MPTFKQYKTSKGDNYNGKIKFSNRMGQDISEERKGRPQKSNV